MRKNLYLTIAISMLILIVSFLILLKLFFVEDITVKTYTCRLSFSDKLYHNVNCGKAKSSYQTTVYEAQRDGFRRGCMCSPFTKASETTLYLHKPHYIPPAIISIAIATVAFFVIKQKYTWK